MEKHTQKFKIRLGLFIFVGLAIFVFAIFIVGKQKNMFNPVFKLTTTFYNVSGLQVGNNVRFSGINVGTVDNITIVNDSTVRVEMLIRQEIKQFIKTDCEVAIGSEGLIGDRLLNISQSNSNAPMVNDGHYLTSNEPVETDAIIASFQVSAQNSEIVTKQLAEIMVKINTGQGTLGRLVSDTTVAADINQTIVNFKNSSTRFGEIMEVTKKDVSDILESFMLTATNVETSTQQLEEVITKVNSGYGTVGKLINDTITSENIDQTIINLKNSSKGLDENLEALKHNIFFRRYFRKKAEAEEKKRLEEAQINNPEIEIEEEK
jgi:phospholipid/cholesterol/gamma-HCH transport system substrate-binding protein